MANADHHGVGHLLLAILALGAAGGALAWAGAGWAAYLLVATLIAAGFRLVGAPRTHWSARALPAPLRRVVAAAAITAGALQVSLPASATDVGWVPANPPAPAPSAAVVRPAAVAPAVVTPAEAAPPARTEAVSAAPVAARAVHIVTRGDSLWRIAARLLGSDASDAEIARAWPALYAANRHVIGGDPHHIEPGQVLSIPAGFAL